MKRIILLPVLLVFGAAALLLAPSVSGQQSLNVSLDSLDGFSITGSATLSETASNYTEVTMNGAGLTDGETHITHIHTGSGCGEGEYGGVVASLTSLEPSGGDSASATTTVETTNDGDPVMFSEIADGGHVLIIHEVDATPAACGVIPAVSADGDVSAPPTTGTGGFFNSASDGFALVTLLTAALAVIGLIGMSAGLAIGRFRR